MPLGAALGLKQSEDEPSKDNANSLPDTIYTVMGVEFEYDDSSFHASEGGFVVQSFVSEEQAKASCERLEQAAWRYMLEDGGMGAYTYDDPFSYGEGTVVSVHERLCLILGDAYVSKARLYREGQTYQSIYQNPYTLSHARVDIDCDDLTAAMEGLTDEQIRELRDLFPTLIHYYVAVTKVVQDVSEAEGEKARAC